MKIQTFNPSSAATDLKWVSVSKDDFFKVINPLNVYASIQPGKYPYTSIYLTPQRQAVGKSVGQMVGGREVTSWFLVAAK